MVCCVVSTEHQGRHDRIHPAFTLIELLVVVAIIAILISILLPSLSQTRQQARTVQCLGRCSELGRGMTLYHTDEGNYPTHQWRLADGSRLRWFNAMAAYVGGAPPTGSFSANLPKRAAVQCCPGVAEWDVGRNNSYGYNYKYLGSTRDNATEGSPYRPYETFPVREVHAPAQTIAFGDSDGTGWKLPWGPERGVDHPDADQNPDRLGNHGYTLDPTYIPLRSLDTYSGGELEPYAWHFHRTFLSDRHLGKANVVCADGHGERVDPRRAYRDNAMWNGLGFDPGEDPDSPWYEVDRHVDYKIHPGSGQEWRYGEA